MKFDSSKETKVAVTRKRSVYSHRIADQQKDKRREEGLLRNAEFVLLSLKDKLTTLASRPGESRKQVKKLTGWNLSAQEALKKANAEAT